MINFNVLNFAQFVSNFNKIDNNLYVNTKKKTSHKELQLSANRETSKKYWVRSQPERDKSRCLCISSSPVAQCIASRRAPV